MQELDEIDKAIINRIQSDFPIASRPYLVLAEDLDLTEEEVLDRVSRLKKNRYYSANWRKFRPRKAWFCQHIVCRQGARR